MRERLGTFTGVGAAAARSRSRSRAAGLRSVNTRLCNVWCANFDKKRKGGLSTFGKRRVPAPPRAGTHTGHTGRTDTDIGGAVGATSSVHERGTVEACGRYYVFCLTGYLESLSLCTGASTGREPDGRGELLARSPKPQSVTDENGSTVGTSSVRCEAHYETRLKLAH
jgi:hypothetical protein